MTSDKIKRLRGEWLQIACTMLTRTPMSQRHLGDMTYLHVSKEIEDMFCFSYTKKNAKKRSLTNKLSFQVWENSRKI